MLSLFKAMNSGGYNARAVLKTGGYLDAGFIPQNIDLAQGHRAGGAIDNPDKTFTVIVEHRGLGHAQNLALVGGEPCGDGRSKPEGRRRIVQSNTHALRTRHRIGLRRNLANLTFNAERWEESASWP